MPVTTPAIKVDGVKRFSKGFSDVILIGNSYDEAYAATKECEALEKRTLVHPFDDPHVIAGQGFRTCLFFLFLF
jgi:threonine dehydratase